METMVINIKSQNDKILFSTLAHRLNLKSRILSEEDKEDYGLLKAMLEAKTGEYVEREAISKALRK